MRNLLLLCCLPLCCLTRETQAAEAVQYTVVDDHLGWGWQAHVIRNDYITLALVPAIGGRVMQYDLQDHPFLWVNPAEIGHAYEPAADQPWYNFGGYKSWVAPQGNWRRGMGGWPPAPTLDSGLYSTAMIKGESGEVTLVAISPPETFAEWQAKDLSLTRSLTVYPGSTRVRVEQRITNHGTAAQIVANWEVTQIPGTHAGLDDPETCWVYFPINPLSMFGERGYFTFPGANRAYADSQWSSLLGDNIVAVNYLRRTGKIGADVVGGWVASVDSRHGFTYIKRFTVEKTPEPSSYPEGGSSLQVFTSGKEPYVEVGVLGPLVDLAPNQSTNFVIDWYSTRIDGPILRATDAGVCKRRLSVQITEKLAHVRGLFGVFQGGTIELLAFSGNEPKTAKSTALGSYYVTPLEAMTLDVEVRLPLGTTHISAMVRDAKGKDVGELDRVMIPPMK
jgi:hypothetical protein